MRVLIDSVDCLWEKDLVEIYPCLENYGYKCKKIKEENIYGRKYISCVRSVKISSLKELFKLRKDVGYDIIIEETKDEKCPFKITIYDDYIE